MKNEYKLRNGYNMDGVCKLAIYTYGVKHQHIKAIEELGELVQAIEKSIVGGDHNVEEETADVEIMIHQLKTFFNGERFTGPKRETIHGVKGMLLIIKDLSYLITELSRAYNGYDHNVILGICKVDEALLHIREIYYVELIEKYKVAKLERLCKNILKCHRSR